MVRLTHNAIDYHELTESVRTTDSGAVVLFLGTVREMTGELRTLALDYDCYPEMAESQLMKLECAVRERWPVERIGVIHRLGHLELGDISVAVAVSCAHRQAAFEAGKFMIDQLKLVVPIWKKENWSDGTTEWVHPQRDEVKPIDAAAVPSISEDSPSRGGR
ncbi:MAG: molybdenum cofactor biosynthesis protein MoaE [Planctomycetaceae bacterium]